MAFEMKGYEGTKTRVLPQESRRMVQAGGGRAG